LQAEAVLSGTQFRAKRLVLQLPKNFNFRPTKISLDYTTGRGGSGNMAKNDPLHPELARASQDVEAPQHREQTGPTHFGRGGAANVISPSPEPQASGEASKHTGENKGLVEKGKEFLSKLGKK
jgi:hypothetical protein